jgi:hypothetical protein
MLNKLLDGIDQFLARRQLSNSPYRNALKDIPESLFPYWKHSAQHEFPGIPQDAFFFARAAEGLLTFFACIKYSRKPCALPSKAADSVWHAWARHAPASLDAFCVRHFGRVIPHVEAASMTGKMEEALLNCLVQARRLEAPARTALTLPRLFALDRELKMPGGFWYQLFCGQVAFSPMNQDGRYGKKMFYPSSMAPAQLLAAGLLTPAEYKQYVRRATSDGVDVGGSCGGAAGCDGDGAGCGGGCGGD